MKLHHVRDQVEHLSTFWKIRDELVRIYSHPPIQVISTTLAALPTYGWARNAVLTIRHKYDDDNFDQT